MHLFQVGFYVAGTLYAVFIDQRLLVFFGIVIGIYFLLSFLLPNAQNISTRKKIMLSTWSEPQQGVIVVKETLRVDKVLEVLEKIPKEERPTLTHVAIKALGQLYIEIPDMNGRLVFGKFVPNPTVDISCLVDLEGGKDLAFLCVRDVANKGFKEIAKFIKQKVPTMKKKQGGQTHQKQTRPFKLIPSFIVSFLVQITGFIVTKLGISINALQMEANPFGAACVTSLGSLNFKDATAPFSGFMNCNVFLSLNSVYQAPVIEDGKIIIGKVVNLNFIGDHRYIDGGRCSHLTESIKKVFVDPQSFVSIANKKDQ